MKMINLLIRELNNCSSGDDFQVTSQADICQLDRFSLEIDFKRAPIVSQLSKCPKFEVGRGDLTDQMI